jgi:hypothetical protein
MASQAGTIPISSAGGGADAALSRDGSATRLTLSGLCAPAHCRGPTADGALGASDRPVRSDDSALPSFAKNPTHVLVSAPVSVACRRFAPRNIVSPSNAPDRSAPGRSALLRSARPNPHQLGSGQARRPGDRPLWRMRHGCVLQIGTNWPPCRLHPVRSALARLARTSTL